MVERPEMIGRCYFRFFSGALGFCRATFSNVRSNALPVSSVPCSRAALMKRFDCSGSSGLGFGLRGMSASLPHAT
jgi:hypothetical protein